MPRARDWNMRRVKVVLTLFCCATAVTPSLGEYIFGDAVVCPDTLPRAACEPGAAGLNPHSLSLDLNVTIAYVRDLLQKALEVEHSTIPLYLTTLYSIKDSSSFAALTMRSVVVEEMLHMVNTANVLNAIGGAPFIDHPDFIPEYPLVVPLINISADIVWLTRSSIEHYQVLESTPPGGYNMSIAAQYLQIVNLLTALCAQHGEGAVFSGNRSLQVSAGSSYGQSAVQVVSLQNASAALLGVADQGGGCPVTGHAWPEDVSIEAGPLGGNFSHAARYAEILAGRSYQHNDAVGKPTGPLRVVNWTDVRRFAPNPTVTAFDPEQCVAGGSWVVRSSTFFMQNMWVLHGKKLSISVTDTWEECARSCEAWTIDHNMPLQPCAMWSWLSDPKQPFQGLKPHSCLLGQGGGPVTALNRNFISGCQFGTACSQDLPSYPPGPAPPPPAPPGGHVCAAREGNKCGCDGDVYYGRQFVSGKPGSGKQTTLQQLMSHPYKKKRVSGSILCVYWELGGDPDFGYYKYCYCVPTNDGGEEGPTPAPAPLLPQSPAPLLPQPSPPPPPPQLPLSPPPMPPSRNDECTDMEFPLDYTGKRFPGLTFNPTAKNATACQQHCCDQQFACEVWQWVPRPCPHPPCPPPGKCVSLAPTVTDNWCNTNCHAHPPFCPRNDCKCTPKDADTDSGAPPTLGCWWGKITANASASPGVISRGRRPLSNLTRACAQIQARSLEFASNYTALLVGLHDVFNGHPDALGPTIAQMYTLKRLAVSLMETQDPRISTNTMGVGPPWQYVPSASKYEARGRQARPLA